jgi:hypothetical protein
MIFEMVGSNQMFHFIKMKFKRIDGKASLVSSNNEFYTNKTILDTLYTNPFYKISNFR